MSLKPGVLALYCPRGKMAPLIRTWVAPVMLLLLAGSVFTQPLVSVLSTEVHIGAYPMYVGPSVQDRSTSTMCVARFAWLCTGSLALSLHILVPDTVPVLVRAQVPPGTCSAATLGIDPLFDRGRLFLTTTCSTQVRRPPFSSLAHVQCMAQSCRPRFHPMPHR